MVNFPTQIPGCDSHSPAIFDLFIIISFCFINYGGLLMQIKIFVFSFFVLFLLEFGWY